MSGGKRWRTPVAKPGELKIVYGKPGRYDDADLCVAWGAGGADKSDARMTLHAFTEKRMGYAFPSMGIKDRPSKNLRRGVTTSPRCASPSAGRLTPPTPPRTPAWNKELWYDQTDRR